MYYIYAFHLCVLFEKRVFIVSCRVDIGMSQKKKFKKKTGKEVNPHVWNADETGLFFRQLPRTAYRKTDSKPVKGGPISKARVSILVSALMAGEVV